MVLAWQICPKMTFFFDIFQIFQIFFFSRGSELLHGFKWLRDIFHGKIEHSWLCRKPMARKKGAHDPYLLAI
jgi:hypothetical protein